MGFPPTSSTPPSAAPPPTSHSLLSKDRGGTWQTDRPAARPTPTAAAKRCSGRSPLEATTYRLRFDTARTSPRRTLTGLYPYIDIVFTVTDPAQHYHIPLLLTANGYTTYRGS